MPAAVIAFVSRSNAIAYCANVPPSFPWSYRRSAPTHESTRSKFKLRHYSSMGKCPVSILFSLTGIARKPLSCMLAGTEDLMVARFVGLGIALGAALGAAFDNVAIGVALALFSAWRWAPGKPGATGSRTPEARSWTTIFAHQRATCATQASRNRLNRLICAASAVKGPAIPHVERTYRAGRKSGICSTEV